MVNKMVALASNGAYVESMLADSPYRDREQRPGEAPDTFTIAEGCFIALYEDFAARARHDLSFWPGAKGLVRWLGRKPPPTPSEPLRLPI